MKRIKQFLRFYQFGRRYGLGICDALGFARLYDTLNKGATP